MADYLLRAGQRVCTILEKEGAPDIKRPGTVKTDEVIYMDEVYVQFDDDPLPVMVPAWHLHPYEPET